MNPALPGLPKPLECLLRGLLEENQLTSWTSDWADGDVKVTIRFSSGGKNGNCEGSTQSAAAGSVLAGNTEDTDSDSEEDTFGAGRAGFDVVNTEYIEGTADKPRRYHLLELANNPQQQDLSPSPVSPHPQQKVSNFISNTLSSNPCINQTMDMMMTEEKGAIGLRGMTPSTSSSSEDTPGEKDLGQDTTNTRRYRPVNLREFGNTYSSSSVENSSPDGYDEVDSTPQSKVYNERNASDTADKFDATQLVDISE